MGLLETHEDDPKQAAATPPAKDYSQCNLYGDLCAQVRGGTCIQLGILQSDAEHNRLGDVPTADGNLVTMYQDNAQRQVDSAAAHNCQSVPEAQALVDSGVFPPRPESPPADTGVDTTLILP